MAQYDVSKLREVFFESFTSEITALELTKSKLDLNRYVKAIEIILGSKGRVVVSGIGKSGHIARKIASTLSSTGTPAVFLHPSEAGHGDLGFVDTGDTVIMLSKSGESDELAAILPALAAKNVPIIAITLNPDSRLGRSAELSGGVILEVFMYDEACPHDLAPTSSTTAMLTLGDAIAVGLLKARNFSSEDFAKLHPAGALGRKLTYLVRDMMVSGNDVPRVKPDTPLPNVMLEISSKRLGITCVVNDSNELVGVITDGDLRRFLQTNMKVDLLLVKAADVLSPSPKTTTGTALAIDALHIMQDTAPKVMQLPILDEGRRVVGVIHLHEIVKAGIVDVSE